MFVTRFDRPGAEVKLSRISTAPPDNFGKEEAEAKLSKLSDELFELQDLMWGARQHGVLVVLQGRDAAGKDGTIKNVMGGLNPRGVSVTSFGVPTKEELEHDFLWRVHRHTPRKGEVAIFNRSHYEDVLVTRVHKLVSSKVWKRRYDQINAFEAMLTSEGTIIVKYFLHITKQEQKERLLEREKHPEKAWKLNPDDWRDRMHWNSFTTANEDMISHCSTKAAPWMVVPSDAKWFRNYAVAESLVTTLRPYRKIWEDTLVKQGRAGRAAVEAYRRRIGGKQSK